MRIRSFLHSDEERLSVYIVPVEMEEAYTELYRQFHHLRSVCLRQTALLQHLSKALQKQQGAHVPDGSLGNMESIPVQCTQASAALIHERPQQLTARERSAATPGDTDRLARAVGRFSDLLAEDMGKLGLDVAHQTEEHGAIGVTDAKAPNPRKTNRHTGRGETAPGWSCRPIVERDFLNLSSGMFMSELELQSQVCEFCHAVFPGDTTTKGEFLRHLHTHIT